MSINRLFSPPRPPLWVPQPSDRNFHPKSAKIGFARTGPPNLHRVVKTNQDHGSFELVLARLVSSKRRHRLVYPERDLGSLSQQNRPSHATAAPTAPERGHDSVRSTRQQRHSEARRGRCEVVGYWGNWMCAAACRCPAQHTPPIISKHLNYLQTSKRSER